MSLILIKPLPEAPQAAGRMDDVLRHALTGTDCRVVYTADGLSGLQGEKLLFAVALGDTGINFEYMRMLARLRREPELLRGCTAGLIVDADSPLYTKSTATELTFAANMAGCAFLGRPLVEATDTLSNFNIQAKNLNTIKMSIQNYGDRVNPDAVKNVAANACEEGILGMLLL